MLRLAKVGGHGLLIDIKNVFLDLCVRFDKKINGKAIAWAMVISR